MNVSNNCFVIFPLLGKPDPKEPRPLVGPDKRRRVIQKGSEENRISWYYAFKLLTERFKAPNTDGLNQRRFEKSISDLRKKISAHNQKIPDVAFHINQSAFKNAIGKINKSNLEKLSCIKRLLLRLSLDAIDAIWKSKIPMSSALNRFQSQETYEFFWEFLVALRDEGLQSDYAAFLQQIGKNPKEIFEKFARKDSRWANSFVAIDQCVWEAVDPEKKAVLLRRMVVQAVAEECNFKSSHWDPSHSIEVLKSELQTRGPLIVEGYFGTSMYTQEPHELNKKLKGRTVYGWRNSDKSNQEPIIGHTIVVVGAETAGSRRNVYYIDPDDTSDPEHPEKQRVFSISYEVFCSSVVDLFGLERKDSPSGYALYKVSPDEASSSSQGNKETLETKQW